MTVTGKEPPVPENVEVIIGGAFATRLRATAVVADHEAAPHVEGSYKLAAQALMAFDTPAADTLPAAHQATQDEDGDIAHCTRLTALATAADMLARAAAMGGITFATTKDAALCVSTVTDPCGVVPKPALFNALKP